MDDLIFLALNLHCLHGGDSSSDVDATKEAGAALLKETDGSYPLGGIYIQQRLCNLSEIGRVSATSEYVR